MSKDNDTSKSGAQVLCSIVIAGLCREHPIRLSCQGHRKLFVAVAERERERTDDMINFTAFIFQYF